MKRPVAIGVCSWFLFAYPQYAQSQESTSPPAGSGSSITELSRAEDEGRFWLDREPASQAVIRLKAAIERYPESKTLRWLLVRAYLKDGNQFWALRTLGAMAESFPSDCEPWLWTAWIQIQQADLDRAREALASAVCVPGTSAQGRKTLLMAMVESHAGQKVRARRLLEESRHAAEIYREDQTVMDRLTAVLDPGYVAPFTATVDLSVGWTSNSRAGSPTDSITRQENAQSPMGQAGLDLRMIAPASQWVRPSLELEGRALGFTAETGRNLSYLSLGARPGLLLGGARPNGIIAYRFESLLLAGGDRYDNGPIWFYNAHRGEYEVNVSSRLSLFGGAGRRLFRESGRSRTEYDQGIGGTIEPGESWRLMGALSARYHNAEKDPYDLFGGSALISAEWRLPKRWAARAGVLFGFDVYPHSAGYFDPFKPGKERNDLLLKLSASGFVPPLSEGLKAGLTYEYSERFSTTDPYDYRDHRLLLKLLGSFSHDRRLPETVAPRGHVAIDYGMSSTEIEERVQDLLRREESVQRGSSCVE